MIDWSKSYRCAQCGHVRIGWTNLGQTTHSLQEERIREGGKSKRKKIAPYSIPLECLLQQIQHGSCACQCQIPTPQPHRLQTRSLLYSFTGIDRYAMSFDRYASLSSRYLTSYETRNMACAARTLSQLWTGVTPRVAGRCLSSSCRDVRQCSTNAPYFVTTPIFYVNGREYLLGLLGAAVAY